MLTREEFDEIAAFVFDLREQARLHREEAALIKQQEADTEFWADVVLEKLTFAAELEGVANDAEGQVEYVTYRRDHEC